MHLVAIGGSDAGISAALTAREADPSVEVTVVSADSMANFSHSGIPFHLSGEVPDAESLAHRTADELESAGVQLRMETTVQAVDAGAHRITVGDVNGKEGTVAYDTLIVATGAIPCTPEIAGLGGPDALKATDGVHVLRSMGDAAGITRNLTKLAPETVAVIGAGYVGLEIAEALALRGLSVTQLEQRNEVMPSADPEIGARVREQLEQRGIEVLTGTAVQSVERTDRDEGRLRIEAMSGERKISRRADLILVATGVHPNVDLAVSLGADLGDSGAVKVDRGMRTGVPDVFAAGDCAVTFNRLLGDVYQPFGTTAHKQGQVAGENAVGGSRLFGGTLGTQVIKVFDHAVGRTGICERTATAAGYEAATVEMETDDRAPYYPGSRKLLLRLTGDKRTRRLLGVQMFGHVRTEVATRIDVASTAIFNEMTVDRLADLDLSYAPPLGRVWNPLAAAARAWMKTP